jgi:DNA repair exonuclease SbcCD ATPase subunit
MVLSMVLTAAGVYALTPVTATLATVVHFNRFEDLEVGAQKQLRENQQQVLNDPNTTELARSILRERFPGVSAGFLDEPRQMALIAYNVNWRPGPDNRFKGDLVLRVSDRTPGYQALPKGLGKGQATAAIDTDRARLYSLAYALYRANGATVESASKLQTDTAALRTEYEKSKARLDEMNAEIERQRAALGKGGSGSVADLQKQATTLESAWTDAVAKVKQLQGEIDSLQKSIPANPQPAGTAQRPVVADDEMTKMESDLKQLEDQIAATRDQLGQRASEARESLKTALSKFDAAIGDAQAAAKQDAALQDYVAAGEQLQKQMRELTDALVQRQEETTAQLAELKQQMVGKIDAHRADALEKDPELKDLSEQLAIANRQYNVAVSSNFKKDADELKAKIGLIEQMIKAKQTLVGDDQFHKDQLDAIDRTIASSQKRLKEQRETLESRLSAQEKAFSIAQPATEKLSPEAKRIVDNLTSQYAAVSSARATYNQASDALNTTGDDEALDDLKTTASSMKQRIATRRKELQAESEKITIAKAEQERMATIKSREADLAAAQEDAQKAEAAWKAINAKLRDAQNVVADSRQATEKLNNMLADRDRLQTDITIKGDTLKQRTDALARAVAPVEPKEADVVVLQNIDHRPLYAGVGMVAVVVAFTGLIWLSSHRPGDDEEAMSDETDPRLLDRLGLPQDDLEPAENGNGRHSEQTVHDEMQHEPDDESHLIA